MQTVWTQIRLLLYEQSDLGPHCLPVCKNRFEKFARIFSRRHKQTTFSDAGFLDVLRVKMTSSYRQNRSSVFIFLSFKEIDVIKRAGRVTSHR